MAIELTCVRGHTWQSAGGDAAADQALSCPTCGEPPQPATAIGADTTIDVAGSKSPDTQVVLPAAPRLPGLEILAKIGQGGMGVVFKARQVSLNRLVAVKLIRGWSGEDGKEAARFRREAETLARIQHPNVVQIYEVGDCDGYPYFIMELIEGVSLAQRLAGRPLPPREAAALVETLARAIHDVHQRGIIHRDLKPANVLLANSDQPSAISQSGNDNEKLKVESWRPRATPKITDFGLARQQDAPGDLSVTGEVKGTPSYMAPEQASGVVRELGPAVDVYALGAVLYELLTGRPPFTGASAWDIVTRVLTEEPAPPSRSQGVPRDLETICLKCLEKPPAKRYASAAELADDLGRFLRGEPVRARRTPIWERGLKWVRRRPAVALILLLAGVALAAGGAAYWYRWSQQQAAERQRAAQLADLLSRADTLARRAEKYKPLAGARIGIGQDMLQDADVLLRELRGVDEGGPKVKEAIGRLQLAFANIDIRRNDYQSALARGNEARAIFDALAAQTDATDPWLEWQARAYETLGRVRGSQGREEAALAAFEKSLTLRQELARRDAGNHAWQAQVASSQHWLAVILRRREDVDGARALHRRALETRRRLASGAEPSPDALEDLARSLLVAADCEQEEEKPDAALRHLEEALGLFRKLADMPDSSDDRQNDLAYCHEQLGTHYRGRGDVGLARKHFEEARDIGRPFVKQYPKDIHWRTQQLSLQFKLADLLGDVTQLKQRAPELLDVNAALRESLGVLADEDTQGIQWKTHLLGVLLNTASVHLGLGVLDPDPRPHFARARDAYREALEILATCRAKEPTSTRWLWEQSRVHYTLAGLARVEGNDAEASDQRRRMLDLWRARADELVGRHPASTRWRGEKAKSHWLLAAQALDDPDTEGKPNHPKLKEAVALMSQALPIYAALEKEEPDRRDWLEGQLQILNLQGVVFQAMDNSALAENARAAIKPVAARLAKLPPRMPPPQTASAPSHLSLTLAASDLPSVLELVLISRKILEDTRRFYELQATAARADALVDAYLEHVSTLAKLPADWARAERLEALRRGRDFLLKLKQAGTLTPDQNKILAAFEAALKAAKPPGVPLVSSLCAPSATVLLP